MNDHEVIDRNGKRVTRTGVIEDGDRLVVKMNMMDGADPALAALASAAALADSVKRNEQFDARGHRPGYATQDSANAGESARREREARMLDAWKNPLPVLDEDKERKHAAHVPVTAPNDQLFAARDQQIKLRDERTRDAWHND